MHKPGGYRQWLYSGLGRASLVIFRRNAACEKDRVFSPHDCSWVQYGVGI